MTKTEKQAAVDDLLAAASLFDDVPDFDAALLDFRPGSDCWSVHEHVVHCLDVDIANFHRYRMGIA